LLQEIMSAHPSNCASMLFPNKFKYALLVTVSSVQENGYITPVPVDAPSEYFSHDICIWWVQQEPYIHTCIHTQYTYIYSTYTHTYVVHIYIVHTYMDTHTRTYMVHIYICTTSIHIKYIHRYTPSAKRGGELLNLSRNQLRIMMGLLTGQSYLKGHILKLGLVDIPECGTCKQATEWPQLLFVTVRHRHY
jgi:hypothetical protein